jgi:hypothetical protein
MAATLSLGFFILAWMWFVLWLFSRWIARSDNLMIMGRYNFLGSYDAEKEQRATQEGRDEQRRIIKWMLPTWPIALVLALVGAVFLVIALAT